MSEEYEEMDAVNIVKEQLGYSEAAIFSVCESLDDFPGKTLRIQNFESIEEDPRPKVKAEKKKINHGFFDIDGFDHAAPSNPRPRSCRAAAWSTLYL